MWATAALFAAKHWRAIAGVLIVLALIGSVFLVKGSYDKAQYDRGFTAAKEQFEPKLTACAADVHLLLEAHKKAQAAFKAIETRYGDIAKAIDQLAAREKAARLRAKAAEADAAKKEREMLEQAVRLEQIINAPPQDFGAACKTVDQLLMEEAVRRTTK